MNADAKPSIEPSSPAMSFLPVAEPDIGPLEEKYLIEAIRSGWISSMGSFIDRFEQAFAERVGTKHCVALANGTVALHVALVAKGIGPGDEVIVPDLTFVATAAAVVVAGATPVLVDVERTGFGVDPELVREAITPRTKAILPVHLYGHPASLGPLGELANDHGLFLLEDAAEAHGAKIGERTVGSIGDAACFSFYGNKIVTTGEGGCLTTNDADLAKRVRFLKDHAMSPDRRYFHPEVGFNYRMTNLQAAIGCAQLERFDELLARKARVLKLYRDALEGSGIELNPRRPGFDPVCWLVTALMPGDWSAERMSKLATRLRADHRVDVRPFFVPIHELPPYRHLRFVSRGRAVSDDLARCGLCLPSSNKLTADDISRVADALRAGLRD